MSPLRGGRPAGRKGEECHGDVSVDGGNDKWFALYPSLSTSGSADLNGEYGSGSFFTGGAGVMHIEGIGELINSMSLSSAKSCD